MSDTANDDTPSIKTEKPGHDKDVVKFPPFPEPEDDDFDEEVSPGERIYYTTKYSDLNVIKSERLHCSACDRHLGCSARSEARMRQHPMLRTLVCHTCHTFYNSGEFEKGDDGSELYCRWCGQGGQVYCCSDCPHVFCAKCIKRNFGMGKIKEIENTDDWKCFKCNPSCLMELRALCWALLRFCDLRNKIAYSTQDPDEKEKLQKLCAVDDSECCKNKLKNKKDKEKKKESETPRRSTAETARKSTTTVSIPTPKLPPSIQVKKFASINLDNAKDKKAQKRSASPKFKPILVKGLTPLPTMPKVVNPVGAPPAPKKIRMPPTVAPVRFHPRSMVTYNRIKPRMPQMPQIPNMALMSNFNGFNSPGIISNMVPNDNINLSLENLTQGLDMSSVPGMQSMMNMQDDVVCTPDFALEPLCEVVEDNNDDDVQCITPNNSVLATPPPLVPRLSSINDLNLSSDNIIQMTENDVTVNAATGGLKFRVDPQTLSSNKMYRLPDGRIFAINANPSMPGGYSATIVAFTESNTGKVVPKGNTYAAKLSAVLTQESSPPATKKTTRSNNIPRILNSSLNNNKRNKSPKPSQTVSMRQCDLTVPIEWYRYNLIDAVDALEYSLSKLNKLKKEATTKFLRTRNVEEMRILHKSLDRLLNTSATRFNEIRDNLNKEMKKYIAKKKNSQSVPSDDDDDVEILNDNDNDDPIFIDENSVESTTGDANHEVDLTGPGSSEHNDSLEKSVDNDLGNDDQTNHLVNNDQESQEDTADNGKNTSSGENNEHSDKNESSNQNENENNQSVKTEENTIEQEKTNGSVETDGKTQTENNETEEIDKDESETADNVDVNNADDNTQCESTLKVEQETESKAHNNTECESIPKVENETESKNEKNEDNAMLAEDKIQDTEMSDELIENLLKDESVDIDETNLNCMELSEDF